MIISIFGDVHGNIDKVYRSAIAWQRENNKKIDIILQVGDLGVYNPLEKPIVSQKILEKNPGELNLYEFLKDEKKYSQFFNNNLKDLFSSIDAKLFFTRGNHDDINYLEQIENENLDENIHKLNEHIFYISDNMPVTFYAEDGEYITIACLGGIDRRSRPNSFEKDPSIAYKDNQLFDSLDLAKKLDIFLTHMHPSEAETKGSPDLTELIRLIQPKYYFFGHHNSPSEFKIGDSVCYGLKKVEHSTTYNIKDKSMIVLEKREGILRKID